MNHAETARSTYRGLYKLGGAAALIVALLTLGEVIGFAVYPQPGTIGSWFALLQSNRIIGLLDCWGLEVPMYAMFAIVFLALYVLLKEVDAGLTAIALVLALVGVAVFFATNNPFALLSLSDQFAGATTDAQRAMLLAAGQAILANTSQRAVGGTNMGLLLVSFAGLIYSSAMLRSSMRSAVRSAYFSRPAAYVGLLAHGLSLADYVRQALTPSPTIALLVILPNALFLVVWYVLVGRRLYGLGRSE